VLNPVVQLDHLQKESERLTDEKPEEAAVINEKIITLTELWHELKQTVCFLTFNCTAVVIIIIIWHAPCQCVAPLATNSLHGDLSKASSIASSKVRLCRDKSLFRVAIQEV